MSYRLINANTIAESYTEVHDMSCIYADLPRGLDGGHYDMRGMDELQAENAKLRELLADLAICACGKYCHGCPHQYDGCDRDERLRELGVEVS